MISTDSNIEKLVEEFNSYDLRGKQPYSSRVQNTNLLNSNKVQKAASIISNPEMDPTKS